MCLDFIENSISSSLTLDYSETDFDYLLVAA